MRLIVASLLLVSSSACANGQMSESVDPPSSPTPSASAPATPGGPDASDTLVCSAVRTGINAFNAGDFSITVDQFRKALPLAKAQAEADPSEDAADLYEAVAYYAELAPEDYPKSAASSPEFSKYKAITLAQCVSGEKPLEHAAPPPSTTT